MSFANEEEFGSFIGRDHVLPNITADTVESAMIGFALSMVPDKGFGWLAMAVRRALAITVPDASDGPGRTSNAAVRAELERLSSLVGKTWLELYQRDHAADSKLWSHAWYHCDGEGGEDVGGGLVMGEPSTYRRFKSAIAELDWLQHFLRDAAKATPSQRGPWRQSEEKHLRVERGQYLATIYEAAFGQPVSANNYPTDARIRARTPFMDFYGRMVALAFGTREMANLTQVVKEVCRLHRQQPAEFADGIIPGI